LVYAISEGIGSAREIARLTRTNIEFRWIVGDLAVSHDKLAQFRVENGEALNQLMTDILASLMEKGLLSLKLVAQDGTRTRAAATAPSFRTYGSLLQCRQQAALHLKAVLAAAAGDDPEYTAAQHLARIAAARDSRSVWRPRSSRWLSCNSSESHPTALRGPRRPTPRRE